MNKVGFVLKFMDIQSANGNISMSKIALGTDYFGASIPEEEAFKLMDRYVELGGNTLDTARIYGKKSSDSDLDNAISNSEPIVGRWIKSRGHDNIILVTKGGHHSLNDMSKKRLDKASIDNDIATSLHELSVDYIDIYFLHRDDPTRPVSEIMDTLHEHIKSGHIHALGASNWSAARINEANTYAHENNKTPFSISQIHWCAAKVPDTLWPDKTIKIMDDTEYALYKENKIPVMAFSSQASGYFSKMISGEALPAKRVKRYDIPENHLRMEKIRALHEEIGSPVSALMIAYITSGTVQGAAIVGCSNIEQLEDSMSAVDLTLTENQLAQMRGE